MALEGGIIASEGGIIALEGSIIALEAVSSFRKRRNRFGGRHYLIASENGIILSLRRAEHRFEGVLIASGKRHHRF